MKLYVKNVKSCSECPACGKYVWYCGIARKKISMYNADGSFNMEPEHTTPDWCPLEDVKK